MRLYPAIDIMEGKCVRLAQGKADKSTVYGDPIEFALKWQSEGAEYLHVVDLDAAFTGEPKNRDIIKKIVCTVKIPVQVGGGVRTKETILKLIEDLGVSRVVMGTVAIEDPDLVVWAVDKFGSDRIVIGIDAKNGKVATRGWVEDTDVDAITLAKRVKEMGIQNIVYTDISKDGMMVGPNTEWIKQMVKTTWINVIASGGISTIEDVKAVRDSGACGVIMGRALYEGSIDFAEAMRNRK